MHKFKLEDLHRFIKIIKKTIKYIAGSRKFFTKHLSLFVTKSFREVKDKLKVYRATINLKSCVNQI